LLLDTHTFLWLRFSPGKVSSTALSAYQDEANQVFLSHASVWEMQIKHQLGKLELDIDLAELLKEQCEQNLLQLLPVEIIHILGLSKLLFHHKDPFDRLLISQAAAENMSLVSSDEFLYPFSPSSLEAMARRLFEKTLLSPGEGVRKPRHGSGLSWQPICALICFCFYIQLVAQCVAQQIHRQHDQHQGDAWG
jgi:PIN domain nuclease of toxin-antitoxin system